MTEETNNMEDQGETEGVPQGVSQTAAAGAPTADAIWAAAGTPHSVFPTTFKELLALTQGTAMPVADDGAAGSDRPGRAPRAPRPEPPGHSRPWTARQRQRPSGMPRPPTTA